MCGGICLCLHECGFVGGGGKSARERQNILKEKTRLKELGTEHGSGQSGGFNDQTVPYCSKVEGLRVEMT